MTDPSDPATLRALADQLEEWRSQAVSRFRLPVSIERSIAALREAAASLEFLEGQLKHASVKSREWETYATLADSANVTIRAELEAAEALCATLRRQLQEEKEKTLSRVDGHS